MLCASAEVFEKGTFGVACVFEAGRVAAVRNRWMSDFGRLANLCRIRASRKNLHKIFGPYARSTMH